MYQVQLSKSIQAKNGGAYFSAVCGSNLVPVSATEGHEQTNPIDLLLNKYCWQRPWMSG